MIDLGNHTDLYGRFVAKQIDSDFNVNVTIVHVPEPTAVWIVASAMAGLHLARRRARSRCTSTVVRSTVTYCFSFARDAARRMQPRESKPMNNSDSDPGSGTAAKMLL